MREARPPSGSNHLLLVLALHLQGCYAPHWRPAVSRSPELLWPPSPPPPPPAPAPSVVVVVASCCNYAYCCNNPINWLKHLPASASVVIMEQCCCRHMNRSTRAIGRCGREAGIYLKYIIDEYYNLPTHLFFMQSDAGRHVASLEHLASTMTGLMEDAASFSFLPRSGQICHTHCQQNVDDVRRIASLINASTSSATSHTFAHFYVRSSRVRRRSRNAYRTLYRIFASHRGQAECKHGVDLATTFERMWSVVFGCAEAWTQGPQTMCTDHPDAIPRKLVRTEESPIGCASWHEV